MYESKVLCIYYVSNSCYLLTKPNHAGSKSLESGITAGHEEAGSSRRKVLCTALYSRSPIHGLCDLTLARATRAATRRAKRNLSEASCFPTSTSTSTSAAAALPEDPFSNILKKYIESCQETAKKQGLYADSDMH